MIYCIPHGYDKENTCLKAFVTTSNCIETTAIQTKNRNLTKGIFTIG